VAGRSDDLGSVDSVCKRGASAELAARRVDDTGSGQPCGDAEDHRRDDLHPGVDAHSAPGGRVYGGVEAPTDGCVRLSRPEAEPLRAGSPDPAGAGRRSVRSAEPVARAENSARRLGSGPEGRAGVCTQPARLLGGVYRCQRPSERSRQIGSPPISAMLDHVARPTFRTRAHGEDLLSPDRLVIRGCRALPSEGRDVAGRPSCQGPPRQRRRSRAGVLRPPPALPHPKAAISASAAWRPTVAGPATGGS